MVMESTLLFLVKEHQKAYISFIFAIEYCI